jgi:hypothetical protein
MRMRRIQNLHLVPSVQQRVWFCSVLANDLSVFCSAWARYPALTLGICLTGKPLLQNILQGKYYMENTYTRPSSASNYKGICLDEQLGQPLVKSIVEGEFYFPKDNMLSKSRKVVSPWIHCENVCARVFSSFVPGGGNPHVIL